MTTLHTFERLDADDAVGVRHLADDIMRGDADAMARFKRITAEDRSRAMAVLRCAGLAYERETHDGALELALANHPAVTIWRTAAKEIA